jgi:hypothetical protein
VGAEIPTMKDFSDLFRLDIDAFKKSDDERAYNDSTGKRKATEIEM